jgi:hypothetical protein
LMGVAPSPLANIIINGTIPTVKRLKLRWLTLRLDAEVCCGLFLAAIGGQLWRGLTGPSKCPLAGAVWAKTLQLLE